MLMPGIQQCRVRGHDLLVGHTWAPKVTDPQRGIELDVSDCTLFSVTHNDRSLSEPPTADELASLLDDALEAISDVLVWERAHDRVGKASSYSRQVGRVDVKFFSVDGETASVAAWKNPAYWLDLGGLQMMAGVLSNMIVTNGVASAPLPGEVRRMLASLDLVNLGFFSEAFLTAFALCDDLVQRVVTSGLSSRGLSSAEQKELLRAIKEDRLATFTTKLTKLCGWQSLEDADAKLFKDLRRVNRRRNNMIHGSERLTREDAVDSIEVLLRTIDWLRSNPFGAPIPPFPLLQLAVPAFTVFGDEPPANEEVVPDDPPTSAEPPSAR